ncbi:cellulose binding domain-containing protein [Streptomyces sp. 142MFCol3.1]|nr:cellulose binding domain-containing protein [Streptomyces sp. 142MFCol3.1]
MTARNVNRNATLAPGSSEGFGFTGSWTGSNTRPTSFRLDDRTRTAT